MSKMTAKAFVDKAVDIAKNYKTLYVMGCFGAPLTGSNVSRYCNNHSYNKNATRTAMIKAAANQSPPVFGFDCVCLIKGILWGWDGDASRTYGGAGYAINGVPDIGADTMITKCTGVSTTGWDDMVIGEAVWMSGHIGIYIGDGLAVECSPKWEQGANHRRGQHRLQGGLQHPPMDQARQAALCGLHRGLYRRRVPGHHPAQQAL